MTLDAGPGNTARLSGTINVAGLSPGQIGGNAAVTGGSVALTSTARIDARGYSGGGTVAVGGGPHGADPKVNNAQYTTVATDALIDASATGKGNGGTVSVWADGSTVFAGTILARGGPQGGNGGWVETSGRGALDVEPTAFVSTLAPIGMTGTWLLDPGDINVTTGTTTATSDNQSPPTYTPLANSSTASVINNGDLVNALNNNNVTISTTCSSCTGMQGNITVSAPISSSWTASSRLDLQAMARSIAINSTIAPSGDAAQVCAFVRRGSHQHQFFYHRQRRRQFP